MIQSLSRSITVPKSEVELHAIRAQGAGGQNVNKVSTAIHLRFDINASSLPEDYKEALLQLKDRRIDDTGIITIKAQRYRSQEKNREDALARLQSLLLLVSIKPKPRIATRPTKGSAIRRVEEKTQRGKLKAMRGKIKEG